MKRIMFNVGWNQSLFEILKRKAENMSEQDKVCGVAFDAISVKEKLNYNIAQDEVDGLENLGVYGSSDSTAKYAMVFMVKGLASKWKQTLGYFLFSKSIKPDVLKCMLLDCLTKLKDTGLHPKFVICDQDATNRSLYLKLNISPQSPFIIHNEEKIHFFYDTPHLLKSVRNNLMKYDFVVNKNSVVKWHYIEEFYKRDNAMTLRLAPKLSAKHIYCNTFERMRVSLAAQVFSQSVAAGIHTYTELRALPSEASQTSFFVEKMDKLFDLFNSCQINHFKSSKCAISEKNGQFERLVEFESWINSLEVIGTKRPLPCISGWRLNLASIKLLWEDVHLNHNYKYLMTNRLNQDALENVFSTIRNAGGNSDAPTCQIFKKLINGMMSNHIFQSSVRANCLDDAMPILQFMKMSDIDKFHTFELIKPKGKEENSSGIEDDFEEENLESQEQVGGSTIDNALSDYFSSFNPCFDHDKEVSSDIEEPDDNSSKNDQQSNCINLESFQNNSLANYFSSFDPLSEESNTTFNSTSYDGTEENAISYVAGYMCHVISKHHDCETCRLKVTDPNYAVTSDNIYQALKDSENKRYLKYPSKLVIEMIKEYEFIFRAHIKDFIFKSNVSANMLEVMKNRTERKNDLCEELHKIMMKKYVSMRIHYYVKFFNRNLGKRGRGESIGDCGEKRNRKLAKIAHT